MGKPYPQIINKVANNVIHYYQTIEKKIMYCHFHYS